MNGKQHLPVKMEIKWLPDHGDHDSRAFSMVLAAAGRAKALAEARTQFQAEKRKAESQCAPFAKRQAAMLEYEGCFANSPYKPHIQVLGREPKLQVDGGNSGNMVSSLPFLRGAIRMEVWMQEC